MLKFYGGGGKPLTLRTLRTLRTLMTLTTLRPLGVPYRRFLLMMIEMPTITINAQG